MSDDFRTCVMVGLGYIGLPTAAVIARAGIRVLGVDINPAVVETINSGRCPIEEPGLPELLAEMVAAGRLTAATRPAAGDVFVIAVPTPFEHTYKPDLSFVEAATRSIAPVLEKGNLVLLESTIPVGATEQAARWIEMLRPDLTVSRRGADESRVADVLVAHCPERILPGQMIRELVDNDRVIGGVCPASARRGQAFYKTFVEGECLITDSRTAELCKLTENAFRDVNIAFANELSVICEDSGINVWELIALANHHPRVNILQPGPGVGGHCIAVDPWFIVSALGDKARLIREARWINSGRPRHVVRQVLEQLGSAERDIRQIACFGLSYKANIDDIRESPAVEVVEYLAKELQLSHPGVGLVVTDPFVKELPAGLKQAPGVRKVGIEEALQADMLVMLVDHRQFREVPRSRVAGKVLIDTRGVWTA
jgi:UDP-N-acetyl-D-mannosaminuronic acid dehydrogenase